MLRLNINEYVLWNDKNDMNMLFPSGSPKEV